MMSKKQQIFRLLLWGYVFTHTWLSWHNVIFWPIALFFLIGTDLLAAAFASLFKQKKLFFCIALSAGFLLLPVLLHIIARICDAFILSIPLAEIYNSLTLTPLWIPAWGFFILSILVRVFPHLYRYGLLPRLCVLILSFWAAEDYKILFYPHPGGLLLSLLIYLSTEAFCLMKQNPALKNRKQQSAQSLTAFFIFMLLPLGACLTAYQFISGTMTKNSGGVLKPTMNSFDFNDSLSLENEIRLGQNLLLFVHLNKEPTEKILFKRHELAGYDPNKGFFALKELTSLPHLPKEPVQILSKSYKGREVIHQEFYLVDIEKDAFFSLDYPKEIIPMKPRKGEKTQFRSSYIVKAEALQDRETLELNEQLLSAKSTQLNEFEKKIYLNYADMKEVAELARQVVDDESSPYNQAKMLETYFKLHYLYSLKPGMDTKSRTPTEALYNFLFTSRKGYCTYFAFSMALMARSLGLPARVVTGFFINPKESLMGYYPVKAQQAHAWVEIFFDNFGWISFDPTSEQIAVDSLDNINNAYRPDDLFPFVEEMLKIRSQNSAPQEQASALKTITPKKTFAFNLLSRQNLFIFGIILLVIYSALLIWGRWHIIRAKHLPPRQKVQLFTRMLIFEYKHFYGKSLTAIDYLTAHRELLDLYRAALFSPNFTEQQACTFLETVKKSAYLVRAPYFRRLCFMLNPSWIFFRINYASIL